MTHTVVQILGRGDIAELTRTDRTDGQLLDLFVRQRDHEAFAAVVRRHGPMVLGVCRRVLRNHADADDAFQAAFLVLARKAARIGTRDLLAQWLYGVAYNTARKLREANTRRALRERPLAELPEPPAARGADCRAELVEMLDEELSRLPERYRVPIVLCDLEGATRREAARLLGWPEGTVAGRLARARAMLAERLAGRGVALPGGILFAVLAERHATACVPELLRAVATGEVAPRIADTTERVVHAMLVKKLKTVGLAVLLCSLAFAGAIGAFNLPATAQPAPPFDSIAKPPAPPNPAAKAEPRIAVAIPLKVIDAKETTAKLTKLFPESVTIVAARDENTLIVYATEKAVAEVREMLRPLGEKDAPKKTTVIRLKTLDAGDAAKALSEIFNGPGGAKRVQIAPLAKENSLVVEASELDTQTLLKLLRDHLDKDPAKEQKKYTVRFIAVPWADVLDWYAEISGLMPVLSAKPVGNITLQGPKDRQLTLGEVTDFLNEALAQQKFILIRREKTFVLHPADEKIDPTLVPRIELSELPNRGKTELVQVLLPLKELVAKDAAPEVQKMLTPFGSVTTLEKTNTLVITDTAGNINRIHQTISNVIDCPGCGDILTHKFKWRKASEEADRLKTLLADKDTVVRVIEPGGSPYDDPRNDPRARPRDPEKKEGVGRVKFAAITVNAKANTITITAPPEKIALAKKIIEENDKPAKPGDPPFTPPEPELRKYPVPAGTAEAIAKTLQADMPGIKVTALPATNELIVLATPAEHFDVMAKIKSCAEAKKPEAPMPAPKPKKIAFQMKDQPWETVLDWFSNESGLIPIYSVKPTGKFTHIPPTPDTQYTVGEIVDILNEGMASQKFMLIRRQVSFTILPTDEKIDGRLERTELFDLPDRGKTEVVQVVIPLKTLDAEEVGSQVQKMLTPFGAVAVLKKVNAIVVVDSAGNVKRIADMIAKVDVPGLDGDVLSHKCKYVKAIEIADRLKTLLADKDTEKRPLKAVVITVDEKTNTVTVAAPQDKITLAKKLIEANDKPAKPGDPPLPPPPLQEPEIRKYPVPAGTADAVAKKLLADDPTLRVIALPTTNEVIVLATPAEHDEIAAKFKKINMAPGVALETVAIPLTLSDPAEMAAKLRKLFPSEAAGGPRIEPRGGEKPAIVVTGTPEQIKEVRIVIDAIEGPTKK